MLVALIKIFVTGAIAYIILLTMHKKNLAKLTIVASVLMCISVLVPIIKPAYQFFNNANNNLQKVEKFKDKPNKVLDFGNKESLNLDKIKQYKEKVEKDNNWLNWNPFEKKE